MNFESPAWLLLLPGLMLAGWCFRDLALWRPLRALPLVMIVVLLARPRTGWQSSGMDLWVLLDRSESTGDRIDRSWPEWQSLMRSGARSGDDVLRAVDFAADAVPRDDGGASSFTGNRRLTRTRLAVDTVLAMRKADRPSRIVLFTDGYSTENLDGLADRLTKENIPLDLRLLTEPAGRDFRVRRFRLPQRVRSGEAFLIEVEVAGPEDGEVPLTILRNGASVLESKVTVTGGRGVARFTDRLDVGGASRYEARISPDGDVRPGNNRRDAWIEIAGPSRVLLVTGYTGDPLAAVLGKQCAVEVVNDPRTLHPGHLSGCRAVVLNNVPAWEMPADFLASLDFFVNGQGGGLMMAGGRRSFGAGGYCHSAIDPLLPVSMELKSDHRKLMASMAMVLDRSGSMSAGVPGGRTKMDLANEGAAAAIGFLGYQDHAAVFAVDSEAHEVIPMQLVGDEANREAMSRRTMGITSGGGGIYVYNGLKAGWKALQSTSAGTRHLILFADAADAEQPGDSPGADYQTLLAELTASGGTCSVIALGTESDTDAGLLRDIAARGKGRIFFTDRPEELPAVFTAETIAVTRSAFVSDPVETVVAGQWHELSGREVEWPGQLGGFNLSYRREWASQALVTADEYAAPLVAWGRRGAGRTAALCFPVAGEFSDAFRSWSGGGDFLQTLTRWLMGEDTPPGMAIRHELTGTSLVLDLFHDPEHEQALSQVPPRILLASGVRADVRREAAWERMEPGHFRVSAELTDGEILRGSIVAGEHTLTFGPLTAGTDTEWDADAARIEELRLVSARSGGRQVSDLRDVWQNPPAREPADPGHWLLPIVLLLVLADALVTRMGWQLPAFVRRGRPERLPQAAPAPASQPVPGPLVREEKSPAEIPPEPGGDDATARRRNRFARAKKR